MKKISSIIPIKTDNFDFYRRRLDLRRSMDLSDVETIVVDDGSETVVATQIEEYCRQFDFSYIRIDSTDRPFSLSRARNYGIYAATCEWIIMEDADIVYSRDFYNKLILEVELIDETPFNFLSVPVVYLKENISESVFSLGSIDEYIPRILMAVQFENPKGSEANQVVESFSPATALFVVRKSTLMHIGVYDEYFEGWGGEDRDVAYRLLAFNDKLKKPSEFEITKNWNLNETSEYKGWRAVYRLTGDYLAAKGLYGFHLFHEKLEWRTNAGGAPNINFAKDKAIALAKKRAFFPQFDSSKKLYVIIGSNPHITNAQVYDALGNLLVLDDAANQDVDAVVNRVNGLDVEAIVFWNPYGSDWRLRLYKKLKELGYRVIVAERGALPDSFYFDEEGLCIESDSYKKFSQLNQFCDEKISRVKEYIWDLRYGSSALESQSSRVGAGAIRLKLNIPQDKKIIFVPLQVASDTVTNFFVEPDRSYQDFLNEIRKLAAYLPSEWVVVIKNHPLNIGVVDIPGVLVGDAFHINDLIEASSAICLFNSGCGLIAMAFDRMVFYYGKCFYSIPGVNERFDSARYIVNRIKSGLTVDKKLVEKFYYFLLNSFYSFAKVDTEFLVDSKGIKKVKNQKIDYSVLRIPGLSEVSRKEHLLLSEDSIILGRYRKHLELLSNGVNNSAKPTALKSPAIVSQKSPKDIKNLDNINDDVKYDVSIKSSIAYKIFFYISHPFLSSQKKRKLIEKPFQFFNDSNNYFIKFFANFLR